MRLIPLFFITLAPALGAAQTLTVDPKEQPTLEERVRREPGDGRAWLRLGAARHARGDLEGAAAAYKKTIELKAAVGIATYNLAAVHARKGERDEAFAALVKAAENGWANLAHVESNRDLASLHGDPRWSATLARMDEIAHPCKKSAPHRQLDFWIGEWQVKSAQGQLLGNSRVERILEGCVIFENWTGNSGYTGKSFNFYDAVKKRWQQTWIDEQGQPLELYGDFRDGAMRLAGETVDAAGKKQQQRLSFTPLPGGGLRQLWESSADGKTWTVVFDGIYSR